MSRRTNPPRVAAQSRIRRRLPRRRGTVQSHLTGLDRDVDLDSGRGQAIEQRDVLRGGGLRGTGVGDTLPNTSATGDARRLEPDGGGDGGLGVSPATKREAKKRAADCSGRSARRAAGSRAREGSFAGAPRATSSDEAGQRIPGDRFDCAESIPLRGLRRPGGKTPGRSPYRRLGGEERNEQVGGGDARAFVRHLISTAGRGPPGDLARRRFPGRPRRRS